MTNKFYNENSFQYAIDLLESDPYQSKVRFEEYLEKYPNDYYARAYYGILLTRLCLFNEAEKEYEEIKENAQKDSFYARNINDLKGFTYNMLVLRIKILAYYEKYEEILELIKENYYHFRSEEIRYISYYCRIRLGKLVGDNIESSSYRFLQTLNYSEDLLKEHLKKHIKDDECDGKSTSVFYDSFPLDQMIMEVKKFIPSDKRLFPGYFDDTYYFRYDNCGMAENCRTNFFKVVCFQNTSNIITMCPAIDCDKLPKEDVNYVRFINNEKILEKRLSRIDKFNQKFNRK